jgi:hypothetical protein
MKCYINYCWRLRNKIENGWTLSPWIIKTEATSLQKADLNEHIVKELLETSLSSDSKFESQFGTPSIFENLRFLMMRQLPHYFLSAYTMPPKCKK